MSRKFILGLLIFSLAYLAIFVRIPKLDYTKSGYFVRCELPGFQQTLLQFGEFSGEEIRTYNPTPRDIAHNFTNGDLDVLAKSICKDGVYPKNPDQYLKDIQHMDRVQYGFIRNAVVNYVLFVDHKVFKPTLGEFIGKLVLLPLLLLVAVLFRPKPKGRR